jgi:hypothetical protein
MRFIRKPYDVSMISLSYLLDYLIKSLTISASTGTI